MNLSEFLSEQNDEFLKTCFDELEAFRLDGVLIHGKVRELNGKFFNNNPTTLFTISEMIYREIAIRHFKNAPYLQNEWTM